MQRETPVKGGEPVTKKELGTGTENIAANWLDIVAKLIPTEVIAGYTLVVSVWVAALEKPTDANPDPTQSIGLRAAFYGFMVLMTFAYSWVAYKRRRKAITAKSRKFQWELLVSTFAFAVWGLASPGSWLIDMFDKSINRVVVPLVTVVAGGLIIGLFVPSFRKTLPKIQ